MPELQFRYPSEAIPESVLQRAFFASWGRNPKPSRVHLDQGVLSVSADGGGSGTVHVPWRHPRLGMTLQSTETLLPREHPYLLAKELGRGELGRIQRRMYEWQMFGFRPSEPLKEKLRILTRRFAAMATSDENSSATDREAIDLLSDLDNLVLEICDEFSTQSLAWRQRNHNRIPLLFGIGLTSHTAPDSLFEFELFSERLASVFHAAAPMPSWREIEPKPGVYRWELVEERLNIPARFGFKILAGPLIDFTSEALPGWLKSRIDEEAVFENAAERFIREFVERFDYIVDTWILSSRFNSHTLPGIPIYRGFSVVRDGASIIRRRSPDKTIMVGIDQPWGEYALTEEPLYSILSIAESLMSCPEIDAFLLELHFGFRRNCTYPRDPMALGTLIDHWSFLGKKVFVSLSIPSDFPDSGNFPITFDGQPIEWDVESQRLWVQMVVRMLLAKRNVHGIIWNSLQDTPRDSDDTKSFVNQVLPYSGLFDTERSPKPVFDELAAVRQELIR